MSEGPPPPAYNANAATAAPSAAAAPPSYNNVPPAAAPVQATQPAPVQYVQPQAANQQPAIQYVDQHGNPVSPPTNVTYVDQNGNPIQTPNVMYVDQNGNPINPPPNNQVPVTNAATPTTQTVPAGGEANQATPNVPAAQNAPAAQNGQAQGFDLSDPRNQRIIIAILAAISALILFIGMCVNSLAHYNGECGTFHCGFTQFRVQCDSSFSWDCSCLDSSGSYADDCDAYADWGYDSNACDSTAVGVGTLLFLIAAFVLTIAPMVFIQPWKPMTPCCMKDKPLAQYVQINLGVAVLCSIISLIIWESGEDYCTELIDMELGGSFVCNIISMVINVIAIIMLWAWNRPQQ